MCHVLACHYPIRRIGPLVSLKLFADLEPSDGLLDPVTTWKQDFNSSLMHPVIDIQFDRT